MKPRRWFLTPQLIQWRYMVACGNFTRPFVFFPRFDNGKAILFAPWNRMAQGGIR